jgi:hypothetical protein
MTDYVRINCRVCGAAMVVDTSCDNICSRSCARVQREADIADGIIKLCVDCGETFEPDEICASCNRCQPCCQANAATVGGTHVFQRRIPAALDVESTKK